MPVCSEPDCDQTAIAQGLCSKHYQQARRRDKGVREKRGPAPKYPDNVRAKYDGAPHFNLRLDPAVFDWARTNGGSKWLRQLVEQLHGSGFVTTQDHDTFMKRITKIVTGAVKQTKDAHGPDIAAHAGSVGKRVATQLWDVMALPEPDPKEAKLEELQAALAATKLPLDQVERIRAIGGTHPDLALGVLGGKLDLVNAETLAATARQRKAQPEA